jgi:hypothetical protein
MTREESVQDLYVDVQRRSVALKGFVKLLVRSGQALVWSGQVSQVRQASKQAGKGGELQDGFSKRRSINHLTLYNPKKKMNRPDAEWQR